jgi:hypothetical protein
MLAALGSVEKFEIVELSGSSGKLLEISGVSSYLGATAM